MKNSSFHRLIEINIKKVLSTRFQEQQEQLLGNQIAELLPNCSITPKYPTFVCVLKKEQPRLCNYSENSLKVEQIKNL